MVRKRRAKYTWLPVRGQVDETNPERNIISIDGTIGVPAGVAQESEIITTPILLDEPQEPTNVNTGQPSLSDIVGSEYIVKRIVGSIFFSYRQAATTTPGSALITAGLFVARADDILPGTPIGVTTAADEIVNYGPNHLNNSREPWMWHRSWVLGNVLTTTVGPTFANAPQTNMNYGDVRSGSHVDCKSARRVRQDERLWLAIQSTNVDGTGATDGVVDFRFIFRALGALRKAKNRSAF